MEPQRNWKAVEADRENTAHNAEEEPLPAYEREGGSTPSTIPDLSPPATPSTLSESHSRAAPSDLPESNHPALGPSVSAPFNFPTTDLPPYSDPAPTQRPIAIPQRWPEPSAPFLTAYAPVLLNYGIPATTFHAFLDTLSAFLVAKVSQRAISHASDIAASMGRVPIQLGKDLVAQAKETGRGIASSAKKRNPIGVVGGLIGGTLGMTVGVAVRTVNSMLQLPAAAAMAAANPKTPRGRAELYIATANKDWFGPRGLNAKLLDTAELTHLLGIAADGFLLAAGPAVSTGNTDEKLKALRRWIADLEVRDSWRDWGSLSRKDTPLTMPDPAQIHVTNTADASSGSFTGSRTTLSSTMNETEKRVVDGAFFTEPHMRNVDTSTTSFSESGESSTAAGKRPIQSAAGQEIGGSIPPGSLRLGFPTLWLVLFPAERTTKGK
ncbi:hypothetical protein FKW77_003747 [Venturia effusa]|uniref:Uncharacterized protein n=1 Tax=Venturia effusa TaxID=50376 RepID=A0A517LR16_9PEZI|nr:hypothetical protein FKW77_003747 [Venturia effusa]